MDFSIKSFGCEINKINSNKIKKKIINKGFKYNKNYNVDFLIINSCSVRNNVINKMYSIFGKIKKKCSVILIGCIIDKEYIKKKFKCVKLITNKINKVLSFLNNENNHF